MKNPNVIVDYLFFAFQFYQFLLYIFCRSLVWCTYLGSLYLGRFMLSSLCNVPF